MYIWLGLLIPILAIVILYIFFSKKIAWWESSLIFISILIFIAIMKYTTELSQVSDDEYIQEYVVRVEYYEEWDEWITRTCSRQCCCTKDSDGHESCSTEYYDCSYRDYHSEYYIIITNKGNNYSISKATWFKLMKQFNTTPIFKDLHRDYYTIDGNMYYFLWDRKINSVEYTTYFHSYENRVQASHSVMNFPDIDTTTISFYNIKKYPKINNLLSNALLGETNYKIDKYINQTNALFANKKQVKIFYLIYKNQPSEAALIQEQYWKGGNKNEVVICIGIDTNRNIKWSYVFSWTKKDIVKVKIRDYINTQNILNNNTYTNIINYSNKEIVDNFERREFKEFSYLTVEPTTTIVIWTYIFSFIITIGMCVWVVNNEFDSDGVNNKKYYGRY